MQRYLAFGRRHECGWTLEAWMDAQKWDLATRKSNMGRFSSLWKVAVDRRWAAENIMDRLEPIGDISVEPEIFSNASSLRLMAVSLLPRCNRIIAPLALGLFGGMRPDEIDHEKFGWHRIELQSGLVTVTGDVAKAADRRTFKLQPVALQWLRLAHKLENPLPPVNERRLVNLACEIATIQHWPSDVLRKTQTSDRLGRNQRVGRYGRSPAQEASEAEM